MKKLTALMLSSAMMLSLAACGGSASTETVSSEAASSEAASSEAVSTEEAASADAAALTTVNAGKLTMSTNAAFPPYEMTTDTGDFEGIDIEVAGAIAKKLGLELQVDDMDFDAALLAAQERQERHGHGRCHRHRRAPEGYGLLRHLRRGHPVHHRA